MQGLPGLTGTWLLLQSQEQIFASLLATASGRGNRQLAFGVATRLQGEAQRWLVVVPGVGIGLWFWWR